MNKLKQYYYARLIVSVLLGLAGGTVLLLLSPYAGEVFDIAVVALGLLTAVLNLPALLLSIRHVRRNGEWLNLLLSLCSILLGVALMLLQTDFLLLLLGIYSVVLPLVRIILAQNRKMRLKREFPRFAVGLVIMAVFLAQAESAVLRFGAYAAYALTLLYLLYGLIFGYFLFSDKKNDF